MTLLFCFGRVGVGIQHVDVLILNINDDNINNNKKSLIVTLRSTGKRDKALQNVFAEPGTSFRSSKIWIDARKIIRALDLVPRIF